MPRNSPTGFICAFFATFMGFALIWHIWWLVVVAFVGAFATFVVFAWRDRTEDVIPADEVARIDRANRRARSAALAQHAGRAMSAAQGTTGVRRPDRTDGRTAAHARTRSGLQAHHRRLRLLDLPAQRHHHVLGVLRDLRGAVGGDGRRPERARICSTCTTSRSRPPACCCPASPAASRASAPGRTTA